MYKHKKESGGNREEADTILNFLKPYSDRFDFCLREVGLPEDTCFEVYLLYRSFINPDLVGFTASNLHQYHILFQILEHELRFLQTEMQGIDLKFVLFSALTCANMRKFLLQMHELDILPLTHPNGYRQVMFVDYRNIYGRGHNALFLHTSPHK